ncbi:MAG: extracellular solute-binding protein [Erysipelotrichaceae bacterium]|nr:extracellular solute-binding protein [Erysipelotrichaceae bacterium]
MKKTISAFALSVLLLGTMTGCGNKGIAPFVMPENGYDGSEVTITFYHAMGQELQGKLKQHITKFESLYPNITVNEQYVGNYDAVRDQLVNEISIGEGSNVAYCYPDHVALYNKSKKVVTLDQFINDTKEYSYTTSDGETINYTFGLTQAQKDDFVEPYFEEGRTFGDGLLYSLPYAKSTEVLYYNETFFSQHELKVPTTWDEMWEVCRQIKEIDPDCYPLGYDSDSNWFITMAEQLGTGYTSAEEGNHYIFNNDGNKAWLRDLKGYFDEGLFTTKGLLSTYTSSLFTAAANPGEVCCYMCIGSSAGASYQSPSKDSEGNYPFNVEIAPIPQHDLNNPKAIQQGPSVCIFNDKDPQKVCASWLFVKYLSTNQELQADMSKINGYTPILKSVSEIPVYKKWIEEGKDIQAKATKVCIEQRDSNFVSPSFVGSSAARDQVGDALDAILSGTKTIDQALQDAVDECEYSA